MEYSEFHALQDCNLSGILSVGDFESGPHWRQHAGLLFPYRFFYAKDALSLLLTQVGFDEVNCLFRLRDHLVLQGVDPAPRALHFTQKKVHLVKGSGQGKKVPIAPEHREFAEWMEPCHKDVMLKRFAGSNGEGLKSKTYDQPVTVIANSTVTEIKPDGEVTLMDAAFRKSTLKVDNVVLASVEPNDGLYEELLAAGITALKIGDASQVRNLRAAVTEGAGAGLTLDEGLRLNANRAMISRLPTEVQLEGD